MKLLIFGATGGTGLELVEQALAAGDQVVAFAREPTGLATRHEQLTTVQGELNNIAAIEWAMHGVDAVISVLSPRPQENLRSQPLTRGVEKILVAMKKQGVRRLILSSTQSESDNRDLPDLKFKALVSLVKTTMRPVYEEIVSVAQVVRASDRDWTIVRVSLLNNGPKSGKVRVGYLGRGEVGTQLSRADLAAFMLKQVEDMTYLRQAPAISN